MPEGEHSWNFDRFLKEGDILFKYMIDNFNDMFDGKFKIKHFDVESALFDLRNYVDDIKEKYIYELEKNLIAWIQKELENNDLFQRINWRPFRDQFILTSMFLGYRKMFQFENYIFQLSIIDGCEVCDIDYVCKYCKNYESTIHFCLSFYGWKDAKNTKIHPYNLLTLSENNIIPESFWLQNLK